MSVEMKPCPVKFCLRKEKHDHTKTALIKKINEMEDELNRRPAPSAPSAELSEAWLRTVVARHAESEAFLTSRGKEPPDCHRDRASLLATVRRLIAAKEEKSDCGHPAACIVHEQGPEDADEVCLWCAEIGAAAQVSEYEKALLVADNAKLNLIVKAARLFAEFWREDAIKTGRGLLLIERLDEYDADVPAPRECPDPEAHEKGDLLFPCDHPPKVAPKYALNASKLGSNQGSESSALRDSLTVQVGQSETRTREHKNERPGSREH